MEKFHFFDDDDEPLPPFTPLDRFCMWVCGLAFGGAVGLLLAGWL
ncbi:hypothetical protein [Bordetella genomosp. 9]|nr:hypothetical protein [Bordetella genomosp. 9]